MNDELKQVRERGCQCGDDEACAFARERDAAREQVARLEAQCAAMREALGHARDTLDRLKASGHDGDEESGEHEEDCPLCDAEAAIAHLDAALATDAGSAMLERVRAAERARCSATEHDWCPDAQRSVEAAEDARDAAQARVRELEGLVPRPARDGAAQAAEEAGGDAGGDGRAGTQDGKGGAVMVTKPSTRADLAAAPELLAALERLAASVDKHATADNYCPHCDAHPSSGHEAGCAWAEAAKAIAQARGTR